MPEKILRAAENSAVEEYRRFLSEVAKFCVPSKNFDIARNYASIIESSHLPLRMILESYKRVEGNDIVTIPEAPEVSAVFTITGHEETESNRTGELTGWLSMPLSDEGRKNASLQEAEYDALVLCSDLPRTIEHGIRKYYSSKQAVISELDALVDKVREDMRGSNKSGITKETYLGLTSLALENGIIPVPSLRAQFFGPIELFIEKLRESKDPDKRLKINEEIIENLRQQLIGEGKDEKEVKKEIDRMTELCRLRGDMIALPQETNGKLLFENYLMYFNRSAYNVFQTLTDLQYRKVDIIGHSGFKNIVEAYFRHIGEPGELHIVRSPTPLRRGQKVTIKTNDRYHWLNDPLKIEMVEKETLKKAEDLRARSLDDKVKHGLSIVKTPLMGFRKKDGEARDYVTYPTTIDEALSSDKPVIIFGHGGEGKSILLTEIARNLVKKRYVNESGEVKFSEYVPVIIDCNELNQEIRVNRAGNSPEQIGGLISRQIANLDPCLLREYKVIFLIDDYHKVNADYQDSVKKAVEQIARGKNLPIIFSRMERTDIHPPVNEGYLTLQVNRNEIPASIDEFIEERITSPDRRESFKKYVSQYDESIKGNFITLYVLTLIYENPEDVKRYFDEKEDAEIHNALGSGKPLKRTQLYEIQTQYVIGNDIERRTNGTWPIKDVREEIRKEKERLANLAFELVFGKRENETTQ